MKKQIANILSGLRVAVAAILIAFSDFSKAFLALYTLCGVTDLLDGPIARATKSESLLGAKLDTAGDVLTYFAMGKILMAKKYLSLQTFLWFLPPLFLMFVSALLAAHKFHTFFFTHNALSKLLGLGLFFTPFVAVTDAFSGYLTALWVIACFAGIEMLAIVAFSRTPNADTLFLHRVLLAGREAPDADKQGK